MILTKKMKEQELIKIIKNELNSKFIGDDCAYLKDLGIVITQDSLVEDVHFTRNLISPYELGYKSVMVNLSDIAASGAIPLYLTVSLSLPKNISADFVKDFYIGLKNAAGTVKIVGGDITGADKIFISITAIGSDRMRKISSRKNAKIGQKVVVSGNHGSSAAGLNLMLNGDFDRNNKFIKSHLMPNARLDFSKQIAGNIDYDYAMMDTSDGLADALIAISEESKVKIKVNFNKIPYDKDLEKLKDWKNFVLFGGEDYELVATLNKPAEDMVVIGEIVEGNGVELDYGSKTDILTREKVDKYVYNHFK